MAPAQSVMMRSESAAASSLSGSESTSATASAVMRRAWGSNAAASS